MPIVIHFVFVIPTVIPTVIPIVDDEFNLTLEYLITSINWCLSLPIVDLQL